MQGFNSVHSSWITALQSFTTFMTLFYTVSTETYPISDRGNMDVKLHGLRRTVLLYMSLILPFESHPRPAVNIFSNLTHDFNFYDSSICMAHYFWYTLYWHRPSPIWGDIICFHIIPSQINLMCRPLLNSDQIGKYIKTFEGVAFTY